MDIVEFCENNQIEYFPINLTIDDNKKKTLNPINHQLYNGRPKYTDFRDRPEIIKPRQQLLKTSPELFTHIWIDTTKVFQVDIDCETYDEVFEELAGKSFYYPSLTKSYGLHIFIKSDFPVTKVKYGFKPELTNGIKNGVELLSGQGAYAAFHGLQCGSDNKDKTILYDNNWLQNNLVGVKNENERVTDGHKTTERQNKVIEVKNDQLDKYRELLKIIKIDKKDRDTWMRICSCLISNDFTENDWLNFCQDNDLNMDFEKENLFAKLNVTYKMSIHYLQGLAKKSNYDEYKKWLQKYEKHITLNILQQGATKISEYLKPILFNNLVYSSGSWWETDDKNFWRTTTKPTAKLMRTLQREIDIAIEIFYYMKNKNDNISEDDDSDYRKQEKMWRKMKDEFTKGSNFNDIRDVLITDLRDDSFVQKLDTKKAIIAFKNGIYNLETGQFEKGGIKAEYLLTACNDFDWVEPTQEQIENVTKEFKKINNWNETHLKYYLSILGYALTGYSDLQQEFYYLRGQTASNGKSIIFETLEDIMPNYVCKSSSDILDLNSKNDKEIPTWQGKLIVWINELTNSKKNPELVKAIGDGTSYKYKRLYSTFSVTQPINFKLFCVSNYSLNIKADNGVARRFRLCQLDSHFSNEYTEDDYVKRHFKVDSGFKNKLTGEYKFALLKVLFNYSYKFLQNNKLEPYPVEWKQEADENMEDCNKFDNWFNETFDLGSDKFTSKKEFEMLLPTEFKYSNIKDEFKRMKLHVRYDSQKWYQGCKGVWCGFKLKPEEVCNDVATEELH
jgi:phage/plasmid-associated DNA primase